MVRIRFPDLKAVNRGVSSSESRSTEERRKHSTLLRRSTGLPPLVVTSAFSNKSLRLMPAFTGHGHMERAYKETQHTAFSCVAFIVQLNG